MVLAVSWGHPFLFVMTIVKIVTTETDMRWGMRGNPERCPIALAANRALDSVFPGHAPVSIGSGLMTVGGLVGRLPPSIDAWIIEFDDTEVRSSVPPPFEIRLDSQLHFALNSDHQPWQGNQKQ